MDTTSFKGLALAILFILAMLGGLIPLKARKRSKTSQFLSLGNMFSGGIFLGGGLLHLLPEAADGLQEVVADVENSLVRNFPWAFFLCGLGFLAILLMEEVVVAVTTARAERKRRKKEQQAESQTGGEVETIQVAAGEASPHLTQDRHMLKLYFSNRQVARGIISSFAPRTMLRSVVFGPAGGGDSSPMPIHRRKQQREHYSAPEDSPLSVSLLHDGDFSFGQLSEESPRVQQQQPQSLGHEPRASAVVGDQRFSPRMGPRRDSPKVSRPPSFGLGIPPSQTLSNPKPKAEDDHGHGHGGEGHHGHGHGDGGDHDHLQLSTIGTSAVAYLLVLALSFHSVFEGIALGTQTEIGSAVTIFLAIAAHTPLAGFALGVSMVKAQASLKMTLICLLIFSLTVPFGGLMGLILSLYLTGNTLTAVSGAFQAFSSGTFLFVAMEEIIPKEMASPKYKKTKLMLLFLGFVGMAGVKLLDTD